MISIDKIMADGAEATQKPVMKYDVARGEITEDGNEMKITEVVEISRREGQLAVLDRVGHAMFRFYPNLNTLQYVVFQLFQVIFCPILAYLSLNFRNEKFSDYFELWKFKNAAAHAWIAMRLWDFEMIVMTIVKFGLVWMIIANFNNMYISMLWAIIMIIISLLQRSILILRRIEWLLSMAKYRALSDVTDSSWRYQDVLDLMNKEWFYVLRFWIPVNSIYREHRCIKAC